MRFALTEPPRGLFDKTNPRPPGSMGQADGGIFYRLMIFVSMGARW